MPDRRDKQTREYHEEVQTLRAIEGGHNQSHRLTVTEVARTLLDKQAARAAHGTVKLTWNAKGDTQIEVEVPTDVPAEAVTAASDAAQAVYDALRAAYPRANGGV